MRSYIRHPSDIPIQVSVSDAVSGKKDQTLNNISHGGLSFISPEAVEEGTCIHISINYVKPTFEADGVVTHCNAEGNAYVVGIEFVHRDDLFVARMVEQVCHIEHYKREMSKLQGRELSGEEAAREWIAKYAAKFPRWGT